jgi:hypothetical protein
MDSIMTMRHVLIKDDVDSSDLTGSQTWLPLYRYSDDALVRLSDAHMFPVCCNISLPPDASTQLREMQRLAARDRLRRADARARLFPAALAHTVDSALSQEHGSPHPTRIRIHRCSSGLADSVGASLELCDLLHFLGDILLYCKHYHRFRFYCDNGRLSDGHVRWNTVYPLVLTPDRWHITMQEPAWSITAIPRR